jgi:cell division protein FtsW
VILLGIKLKRTDKTRDFDNLLFFLILTLMGIGLIMVFSASSYYMIVKNKSPYFFLLRQLFFAFLGVVGMLIVSKIDYHKVGVLSPILAMLGIIMLFLVAIPGIGTEINGARRWFDLGFTTFQPSEFMKIAMILALAFSLSQRAQKLSSFWTGMFPYLIMIGIIDVELKMEPHHSAMIIFTAVAIIMLICAGSSFFNYLMVLIPLPILGFFIIKSEGYQADRIKSFFSVDPDVLNKAYQITNSIYAIGSGSWFGKGLGGSIQKNLYIPEPYNDFIFAILAEELGFIGAASVLVIFILLIWRGMKIAMNAPDMLGSLIAAGLTSLLAIQIGANIAVVTKTIPTTGIPLPFFSYGGTSLFFLLLGMGVMLNISRGSVPGYRMTAGKTDLSKKGRNKS